MEGQCFIKLDGVGPFDNRPCINKQFVKKTKKNKYDM